MLFSLSSVSLAFALVSSTLAIGVPHEQNHQLGKRVHGKAAHLEKRFSGTATYFIDGLGACGITNGPSDFIVALNTPQYGSGSPGPQCFKYITITAGGKSAVAQITDECPTCGYGSLDMSEGLFTHFNPTSVGVFQMSWTFNDGGSTSPTTTHTTYQWTPTTTTTHTTHHTTHTTTSETTTSTTSTSESLSSSSSLSSEASSTSTSSSSSASTSATPTTGSTTSGTSLTGSPTGGNIVSQQKLIANLGMIAAFGKSS